MWYEKSWKRTLRNIFFDRRFNYISPKKILLKNNIFSRVVQCNHHDSHAAACLYTFNNSAENYLIFVIDAVGEFDCISTYKIIKNKMKIIDKVLYPNSLGLFYSSITDLLGLKANEDEYILIGMASYGNPEKYYNKINNIIFKNEFGHNFYLNRGCVGIIGKDEIISNKFDIAAATQKIYEDKLLRYVKKQMYLNKSSKIMLAGGCALNCSANSKLLNFVDDVYIFPHPGDGVASVGSSLLYNKKNIEFKNAFLGFNQATNNCMSNIVSSIEKNGYCFIVDGKAEFGPRALGNRSILADPRNKSMQDKINEIKGRELFRPFAPCILREYFEEYFYTLGLKDSPYMQFTFKCKKPHLIPATVHVYGTSRVQTVDNNNPFLYKILKSWFKKTGCPVLLNTSLNIKGKPLVNSKKDLSELFDVDNNI